MTSKTFYLLIEEKNKSGQVKSFDYRDDKLFREYNEKGFGVYFSVNEFSGARQNDLCVKLRYIFSDFDIAKSGDGQTREQKQAKKQSLQKELITKCDPSLIIDTSNGLQPLWELINTEVTVERRARYRKVICGIIEWSKLHGSMGDSVKDEARVLRMPGFYHMKESPYYCDVIYKSEKKYNLADLEKIFPYDKPVSAIKSSKTSGENPLFNKIKELDFQDIIIKAFAETGRPVSFDVSGHLIDPIGKTTGTFQGREGDRRYLASSSHEPYRGNEITSVADILKISYGDAFKWICNTFNLNPIKETKRETKLNQSINKVEDPRYTWGTRDLDTSLAIIKPGNFIVVAAKSNSGKTTFVFDMACKNARLGHNVLFLSLEMMVDDILDDFGRKYAGITVQEEFDRVIPPYKEEARIRKINEIKSIPNLYIKSIRRAGDEQWEDIEDEIVKISNVNIAFIDNLDLISSRDGENDLERQKRIVRSVLNFTARTKIPVVLIHHYRKSGTKDMGMDEMAGSGKIRDGADRVIKVTRNSNPESVYPEKFKTNIFLQKGRGYHEAVKDVYFIRGTFVDKPPTEEQYYNSGALSPMTINNLLNN